MLACMHAGKKKGRRGGREREKKAYSPEAGWKKSGKSRNRPTSLPREGGEGGSSHCLSINEKASSKIKQT